MKAPLVSVCIITYNQQEIIGNVLDYILSQEVDFDYEVVVGEDCSKDNTDIVCKEYKKAHPDKINLILNEKNLGLIENFKNTISQCTGKYIAICAGDDFWINPQKLQKQVSFLEKHPDFSMCSCEAFYTSVNHKKNFRAFAGILYNNFMLGGINSLGKRIHEFFLNNNEFWKKRVLPQSISRPSVGNLNTVLRDLDKSRYYPASGNIFRREVFDNIPSEAYKYKAEHILTILWAAVLGKIKLLSDVMVLKNTLSDSVTVTKVLMDTNFSRENKYLDYIKVLNLLKNYSSDHDKKLIDRKITELKMN